MSQKDSLHELLSEPVSGRMWVVFVVSSVASTALGVVLLIDGDWLPGAMLVAVVVVVWASRVRGLWRRQRGHSGPVPPKGGPTHEART